MIIKSTEKTKLLFDPERSTANAKEGWGDQIYLNQIKNELDYKVLPLNLFPNGRFFKNNHLNINPYMIHFNWVIGHEKKDFMKKYNHWYI